MIRSFKADTYRLLRSKGFYIFIGLCILTYVLTLGFKSPGGIVFSGNFDYNYEALKLDIAQTSRNFNYYYFLLMPVFMIIIPEFTEKAYKNTITSVSSKSRFFITKFVFAEIVSVFFFVIFNIGFYGVNKLINEKKSSDFGEFFKYVGLQIPVIIGMIAVFVFAAFLFRKASIFNSVIIVAPLVINLLVGILSINKHLEKIVIKVYKYEISNMLDGMVTRYDNERFIAICMIISVCLTVGSFILGLQMFKERELD